MECGELFAAIGCPWYHQGQSERIECDRLSLNAQVNAATSASSAFWHQQAKGLPTPAPAMKSP